MRVLRGHPPNRHGVSVVPGVGWVQHFAVVLGMRQQLQRLGIIFYCKRMKYVDLNKIST